MNKKYGTPVVNDVTLLTDLLTMRHYNCFSRPVGMYWAGTFRF